MPQAAREAAIGEELRRAGLPPQGPHARLLRLLRTARETHLGLGEIARMAEAAGLEADAARLSGRLDALVAHRLLERLPSTGPEPVFDTVTRPHFHLVDEATAQTVDLDVSAETLLAILRQTMAERPGQVEVTVRVRSSRAVEE